MTRPDAELFALVRERLFTAVVGDVMDVAGLTRQFLPPTVRALRPDMVVVGRAMPVLEADCAGQEIGHSGRAEPFGLMLRALDELKEGEVYVAAGASPRYALWGGLMSTRAQKLGATGAVLEGFHRDTREVLGLGFPVFSAGAYAQDQRLRGRVVDYRCRLEFSNGAQVAPDDLVFGDIDGVLIVPRAHVDEVVAAALAKVEGESAVRDMIEAGEATDAIFRKTGIM
jgi:4-hydroxy-4-methyl-2-oxoglutarate aldolase